MPIAAELNETLIRDYITRSVSDVFKIMLGHQPVFIGPAPEQKNGRPISIVGPASGMKTYVVGAVGFLGEANGLLYLYLEEPFAQLCTRQLLGMTEKQLARVGDEAINDAIGELTNMTAGSFKNGLCDAGYPCKLTIPSILRGSNFSIEPISSASRYVYHFESAGQKLVADILLKTND